MRIDITALLVITVAAGVAGWAKPCFAQQGRSMEQLLRPYLDPDFTPTEGPDTDKAFIAEHVEKIRSALPAELGTPAAVKPRVLALTQGTYGTLHVPGAAGLLILLRESAAKHGALELTELYSDRTIDAEMLKGFDVVVLNQVGRAYRPEVFNEVLPAYVKGGGGLFAVHGSALAFMKQPEAEYNRLLGAYVDTVNTRYGHPKRHGKAFPIHLPKPGHPLVAAFHGESTEVTNTHRYLHGKERRAYPATYEPPKSLADELYALVPVRSDRASAEVLVSIDRQAATQEYPEGADAFTWSITWINHYGRGRVFYTQLGHNLAVYAVPAVAQHMLDGLIYAAVGKEG